MQETINNEPIKANSRILNVENLDKFILDLENIAPKKIKISINISVGFIGIPILNVKAFTKGIQKIERMKNNSETFILLVSILNY